VGASEVFRQLTDSFAYYLKVAGDSIYYQFIREKRVKIHLECFD